MNPNRYIYKPLKTTSLAKSEWNISNRATVT